MPHLWRSFMQTEKPFLYHSSTFLSQFSIYRYGNGEQRGEGSPCPTRRENSLVTIRTAPSCFGH
jgi:hypothetical protein